MEPNRRERAAGFGRHDHVGVRSAGSGQGGHVRGARVDGGLGRPRDERSPEGCRLARTARARGRLSEAQYRQARLGLHRDGWGRRHQAGARARPGDRAGRGGPVGPLAQARARSGRQHGVDDVVRADRTLHRRARVARAVHAEGAREPAV